MAECLYAWDHLNSETRRKLVEFPQLLLCICATHVSEERLILDLICVFGVKHDHVVSEKSYLLKIFLHVIDGHDGISRTVDHYSEHQERAVFLPDVYS